ncbi:MAG: transposase [Patescibacteria group bacterium]
MIRTFKYRIYPTTKQTRALQASLNACRWVYNKTLETKKKAWEDLKISISFYDTNNLLPTWKKENNALKNVYSQCLQDTQGRLDLAFKAFFCRIKAGEKPGYPRFKSFDRYDSFTYPQSGFKLVENKLKLSKIGSIKIKIHRELIKEIKRLTIRKDSMGKWFACFACEVQSNLLPKVESTIGIDVGLTSFATFSDGTKIENPRFFREDQSKLAKAQRRLSKADKGTEKRKKLKKVVSHIHEKIRNKRSDFAHKLSRDIVNTNQIIAFEKLEVKNMMENHTECFGNKLNKSIADVAWNQFMNFTTYKAEDAGRTVIFVNPRNTSQMCSQCGEIVKKDLSVRVHVCDCGLTLDRDHNAALNILALGMQSLTSV